MSRRTRTSFKRRGDSFGMGTNHHEEYASSVSHFPKSYSSIGKPIKFPSMNALPFLSDGKITFYGSFERFAQKFLMLSEQELSKVHTANIGICGDQIRKMSEISTGIFAISMVLCCVNYLFSMDCYRSKYHTKYSTKMSVIRQLFVLLLQLSNLRHLMLTFQDNQFTEVKSCFTDQQLSRMSKLQSVTLRNLSYAIGLNERDIKKEFENTVARQGIEFNFVWEYLRVQVNTKDRKEEEENSIRFNNELNYQ